MDYAGCEVELEDSAEWEVELEDSAEFQVELEKRGAPFKYGLVDPYLGKFSLEDLEDVPNSYYYSSDVPDDMRHYNAHYIVKRFLKQVRESNGYDVDCYPPPMFCSPFVPINLSKAHVARVFYEDVVKAIHFAINKINTDTGKHYELVQVKNAVHTTSIMQLLLTFVVKDAYASLKTVRAMVEPPYPADNYELLEWVYKSQPPITEKSHPSKKAKIGEGTSNYIRLTLDTLPASNLEHVFSLLDERSAVILSLTCKRCQSVWLSFKRSKFAKMKDCVNFW